MIHWAKVLGIYSFSSSFFDWVQKDPANGSKTGQAAKGTVVRLALVNEGKPSDANSFSLCGPVGLKTDIARLEAGKVAVPQSRTRSPDVTILGEAEQEVPSVSDIVGCMFYRVRGVHEGDTYALVTVEILASIANASFSAVGRIAENQHVATDLSVQDLTSSKVNLICARAS